MSERILPALAVEGELSIYRAAELKPVLLEHAMRGAPVDLSAVTLLDTAGLQLLLLAARCAREQGRTLHLAGVSHAVRELVGRLGLATELGLAARTDEPA